MNKKVLGFGLSAVAVLSLAACGSRDRSSNEKKGDTDLKVAMVSDTGGIDDRSFNQSAWEGLQAWGKEHGLSKDNGYTYFQSNTESEFANNFEQAVSSGYNLVFGIGYKLTDALTEAANNNKDTKFVIIDNVVDGKDNVASATFADQEGAYLAGVAAAISTKTNKIGFIGGVENVVIKRFEAGYVAGAKSVNKDIEVKVDYAASFSDAAKGKTIASAQYATGTDVIFQAAGGVGNGVFSAAKAENENKNEADKVWVIGVDRDQKDEGNYKSKDGKDSNFVLGSTIKKVGQVLQIVSDETVDGKFPGGKHTAYGIKDGSVDFAETSLSDDAKAAVADARTQIKDEKITVPEK
ncbi:BMP family ABC transporter substrate-binding protein [Floricoccus penangensis]|uniref:BMP family ABC transporter substrate-binding protein n=1 Tax=Floricoccus penangensis TaxID=1859475 RepID=A0A9Q5NYZ1_9LACT|nr:BMP family protein [Floricoccus penangensis]OFI46027.1 BMP family ABC transporter substrate-binding protein [Floricoccus penangensis]